MKVLVATPYYPPEGGGLERYAHETLRRLCERGHDVTVLTATRTASGEEDVDGVRVRRRRPWAFASNTPLDPGLAGRVARESRDVDVVVAHGPVPGPIEGAALGAWRSETPLVVAYHAGELTSTSPLLRAVAAADRRTLEALAFQRAAHLVAVTRFVRDGPLASQRHKATVIPPGVDLDRLRPGPPTRDPEILFVGPLDPAYRWKGYEVLWEAFDPVAEQHPHAMLTLIGDGPDREAIREEARRLGLLDRVHLPGRVSDADLVAAYQRAACVALPSVTPAESFGMVLAEANACGTPVVGSRVGGIPCFIRHGDNGLLTSPGDADGLADALLHLLDNPDKARRMGEHGRRLVEAEHDWNLITDRWEGVLESAQST